LCEDSPLRDKKVVGVFVRFRAPLQLLVVPFNTMLTDGIKIKKKGVM
jgi:hypothetical protein